LSLKDCNKKKNILFNLKGAHSD